MMPIQMIIVNAGVQMSKINELNEIFSPVFIASLIMLASIPICIRVVNKLEPKKPR